MARPPAAASVVSARNASSSEVERGVSSCSGTPGRERDLADPRGVGRRRRRALRPAPRRAVSPSLLERRAQLVRPRRAHEHARARAVRLCTGPCCDEPAAVDDDDVVDGLRDLGEHVARDEHRAALGGHRRAGSRAASGCPAGRGRWRARRGRAPAGRRAASRRARAAGACRASTCPRAGRRRRRAPRAAAPRRRAMRGSPAIAASARRWLRPRAARDARPRPRGSRRRCGRARRARRSGGPAIVAVPAVGRARPRTMRSVVVLPAPFGPEEAGHRALAHARTTGRRPRSRDP